MMADALGALLGSQSSVHTETLSDLRALANTVEGRARWVTQCQAARLFVFSTEATYSALVAKTVRKSRQKNATEATRGNASTDGAEDGVSSPSPAASPSSDSRGVFGSAASPSAAELIEIGAAKTPAETSSPSGTGALNAHAERAHGEGESAGNRSHLLFFRSNGKADAVHVSTIEDTGTVAAPRMLLPFAGLGLPRSGGSASGTAASASGAATETTHLGGGSSSPGVSPQRIRRRSPRRANTDAATADTGETIATEVGEEGYASARVAMLSAWRTGEPTLLVPFQPAPRQATPAPSTADEAGDVRIEHGSGAPAMTPGEEDAASANIERKDSARRAGTSNMMTPDASMAAGITPRRGKRRQRRTAGRRRRKRKTVPSAPAGASTTLLGALAPPLSSWVFPLSYDTRPDSPMALLLCVGCKNPLILEPHDCATATATKKSGPGNTEGGLFGSGSASSSASASSDGEDADDISSDGEVNAVSGPAGNPSDERVLASTDVILTAFLANAALAVHNFLWRTAAHYSLRQRLEKRAANRVRALRARTDARIRSLEDASARQATTLQARLDALTSELTTTRDALVEESKEFTHKFEEDVRARQKECEMLRQQCEQEVADVERRHAEELDAIR